jgi:hypothetical protein
MFETAVAYLSVYKSQFPTKNEPTPLQGITYQMRETKIERQRRYIERQRGMRQRGRETDIERQRQRKERDKQRHRETERETLREIIERDKE